jgi:PhoH-like ATPase
MIEEARFKKESSLIIERRTRFGNYSLDSKIHDHVILATMLQVHTDFKAPGKNNKYREYGQVKLVTRDKTMRIIAREMNLDGLLVEDYKDDQVKVSRIKETLEVKIPNDKLGNFTNFKLKDAYNYKDLTGLHENDGVICMIQTDKSPRRRNGWKRSFAAIYKKGHLKRIDENIHAGGISPRSLDSEPNWSQMIALEQLMDPSIPVVFMEGGAGSGKTLLAMAAGYEQCYSGTYRKIIVALPLVAVGDKATVGFLPGDLDEKLAPWKMAIFQAIELINEKFKTKISPEKNNLLMAPLDYWRGQTITNAWFVVDEAQNLTLHQIRTLITRVGTGTKIIFTGDLNQIDLPNMNKKSSGLASATSRLAGKVLVGITIFKKTVRSLVAALGAEL